MSAPVDLFPGAGGGLDGRPPAPPVAAAGDEPRRSLPQSLPLSLFPRFNPQAALEERRIMAIERARALSRGDGPCGR
jgi:hypothetical protein